MKRGDKLSDWLIMDCHVWKAGPAAMYLAKLLGVLSTCQSALPAALQH